jgi:hypothetical protein
MWPPRACECRSCLPEVAKTSVAAMVQLWETGPSAAPPPVSLSPLPASASIIPTLSELVQCYAMRFLNSSNLSYGDFMFWHQINLVRHSHCKPL